MSKDFKMAGLSESDKKRSILEVLKKLSGENHTGAKLQLHPCWAATILASDTSDVSLVNVDVPPIFAFNCLLLF